MTELEEMRDSLMGEQRRLIEEMKQYDTKTKEYQELQIKFAENTKTLITIRREIDREDNDYVDRSMKMDEMDMERKENRKKILYEILDIVKEFGRVALSACFAYGMIKLIYAAEQDSLMPNNKVSIATKYLMKP